MTKLLACVAALCWTTLAQTATAQLSQLTNDEATAGLKAALESAAQTAVGVLGRQDGFFGNPKVKIPLPESLAKVESVMRRVGLGKQADELILTLNRAAEAAVPDARDLFIQAATNMSVADAKEVLTGGETAGTAYFRRSTEPQLQQRFLPIVHGATEKVALTQKYNDFAKHGVPLGLVKADDANLDQYVTRKALDGLFLVLGEEEKKIRANPVAAAKAAGKSIIDKVFGALRP